MYTPCTDSDIDHISDTPTPIYYTHPLHPSTTPLLHPSTTPIHYTHPLHPSTTPIHYTHPLHHHYNTLTGLDIINSFSNAKIHYNYKYKTYITQTSINPQVYPTARGNHILASVVPISIMISIKNNNYIQYDIVM